MMVLVQQWWFDSRVRCGLMVRFGPMVTVLFWVTVQCYWVMGHGFDLDFGSLTVVGRVPTSPTV